MGILDGLSGFGNSQKTNVNTSKTDNYYDNTRTAVTADNGSFLLNADGSQGNTFNLTDGGAVAGAFDVVNKTVVGAVGGAFDVVNNAVGDAFRLGAGSINFAGDALTKSLGASSDSFSASLGFSNDVFTKALAAVDGANSVSTDAFNTSVGFGSKALDFADVALGDAFRFGAGSINFAGDSLAKSRASSSDAVSQSLAASADSQRAALLSVNDMANNAFSLVAANDVQLGKNYDKLLLSTGTSLTNILDSVKASQSFVSDAQSTAKGALDSRTITVLVLGLGAVALFLIKR